MNTIPSPETGDVHGQQRSPLLSMVTVLHERPGNLLEAMVPVELINREEVAVEAFHVDEIASSIEIEAQKGNGTGQLTPVLLGEIPGINSFFIIDGFHRDASLARLGLSEIFATIRPNSTMEDIYDLRILTANTSHPSVMFPRVIEWAYQTWQQSPWGKDYKITQAFLLTLTSSSGRDLGMTEQDATDIKAWVIDKCAKWNMSITRVQKMLVLAQNADPAIIKDVRSRRGRTPIQNISQEQLRLVATALPGEENYGIQRVAARIIIEHDMNNTAAKDVADRLKVTRSVSAAEEVARRTDWQAVKASHARRAPKGDAEHSLQDSQQWGEMTRDLMLDEIEIAALSLHNLVLSGNYTPPPLHQPKEDLGFKINTIFDRDIEALVTPLEDSAYVERFLSVFEDIRPKAVESYKTKYSLKTNEIESIMNTVASRILADMESGDLQHVRNLRRQACLDLINNCILDELSHRQPQDAPDTQPNETTNGLLSLDIDEVIQKFPELNRLSRRFVVLRGLFRLSSATITQLITTGDPAQLNFLLSRPRQALSTVNLRTEDE